MLRLVSSGVSSGVPTVPHSQLSQHSANTLSLCRLAVDAPGWWFVAVVYTLLLLVYVSVYDDVMGMPSILHSKYSDVIH